MPNTSAPKSSRHRGIWHDMINDAVEIYHGTTAVLSATASAVTHSLATTFSAAVTFSGATTMTGKATVRNLAFGAGEAVTLVSNVATITKSYVILDAEGAGTTDQLDTLTKADAADGDVVLLTVNATDTITVDDANINLAAATRAIAPGGSLLLRYDGTEWTEVAFTAATDNV